MIREVTIGVDIGGTNTKFGVVDLEGQILAHGTFSTEAYKELSIEEYLNDLYLACDKLISGIAGVRLIGVGVGAPNGNYYKGSIEFAPNLPWKGKYAIANMLQERFKVPVCLTNDANAAAIGEMTYGAAKGMKDFIVITLGTGVGSGIVANGHLIYGHDGFAGELGHTTIYRDGRQCTCGKKGCLEEYASARGLRQTAQELLAKDDIPSELRKYDNCEFSTKDIYTAASNGDAIAKQVFEITGDILGYALSNFIAFSSPEAIIFFGGVTQAGEILFMPIRKAMEDNLLKIYQNKVKIIPSALSESDAAILGASALIVHELKNMKKMEKVVL